RSPAAYEDTKHLQKITIGVVHLSTKSHGQHIFLDYNGFFPSKGQNENWFLQKLQQVVERSTAREVHAHIEAFDGIKSPPGFAAVVLLDESHLTAHCYSELGWLAIDAFTCGGTDPNDMIADLKAVLEKEMPSLVLMQEQKVSRFLHSED
ncbi:MAG: S-adenosylmethionine decarboxylase family protein, partial [Candidatus Poseidoniaceae archaeon]